MLGEPCGAEHLVVMQFQSYSHAIFEYNFCVLCRDDMALGQSGTTESIAIRITKVLLRILFMALLFL